MQYEGNGYMKVWKEHTEATSAAYERQTEGSRIIETQRSSLRYIYYASYLCFVSQILLGYVCFTGIICSHGSGTWFEDAKARGAL